MTKPFKNIWISFDLSKIENIPRDTALFSRALSRADQTMPSSLSTKAVPHVGLPWFYDGETIPTMATWQFGSKIGGDLPLVVFQCILSWVGMGSIGQWFLALSNHQTCCIWPLFDPDTTPNSCPTGMAKITSFSAMSRSTQPSTTPKPERAYTAYTLLAAWFFIPRQYMCDTCGRSWPSSSRCPLLHPRCRCLEECKQMIVCFTQYLCILRI